MFCHRMKSHHVHGFSPEIIYIKNLHSFDSWFCDDYRLENFIFINNIFVGVSISFPFLHTIFLSSFILFSWCLPPKEFKKEILTYWFFYWLANYTLNISQIPPTIYSDVDENNGAQNAFLSLKNLTSNEW